MQYIKLLLYGIIDNMSALVQNRKIRCDKLSYTTTMGNYIVNFNQNNIHYKPKKQLTRKS